jgi:sulfur carrier protein ThiS adenylyltransferase
MSTALTPRAPVSYADRDVRQRQLVPPEKLAAVRAVVVGVGAVGRQVAVQLAATGAPSLDLVDHDVVGVENLAPQAFWQRDVGRPKVEATAEACRLLNPSATVVGHPQRFHRSSPKYLATFTDSGATTAVFCCVDSITARHLVWEAVRGRAAFFADGRMSAEVIRVLASGNLPSDAYYATTLFAPEQAHAGSCTARSTVYTATIAAGLMLTQFTRWLRGLPVDRDVVLNLLSMELCVA